MTMQSGRSGVISMVRQSIAGWAVPQPTPYGTFPRISFDHLISAAFGDLGSQPFGTILCVCQDQR